MSDSARYALHRPELLDALERGERKIAVLAAGDRLDLAAGTTVIEADRPHDYVYRLLKGWVGRTRLLEDGRNQFILIFLPGDLFAVKSMLMCRHIDAVQTLSAITAERIDRRTLYEAFAADSDVASRCLWQVMEEERRLTQAQLADHLGITSVHVNRVLKMFRESGWVTVRDGWVTITDLEGLAGCAAPLLDAHERTTPEYWRARANEATADDGGSRASRRAS